VSRAARRAAAIGLGLTLAVAAAACTSAQVPQASPPVAVAPGRCPASETAWADNGGPDQVTTVVRAMRRLRTVALSGNAWNTRRVASNLAAVIGPAEVQFPPAAALQFILASRDLDAAVRDAGTGDVGGVLFEISKAAAELYRGGAARCG
jgi:hypothetical protein